MKFRSTEREAADVERLKAWWGEDMIEWVEKKNNMSLRVKV